MISRAGEVGNGVAERFLIRRFILACQDHLVIFKFHSRLGAT